MYVSENPLKASSFAYIIGPYPVHTSINWYYLLCLDAEIDATKAIELDGANQDAFISQGYVFSYLKSSNDPFPHQFHSLNKTPSILGNLLNGRYEISPHVCSLLDPLLQP